MGTIMKIEKDVPIPPDVHQKYPFSDMKVGDSFSLEWDKRHNLRQAAFYYKKHNKQFNFKTARMNGKVRIWRIKEPA